MPWFLVHVYRAGPTRTICKSTTFFFKERLPLKIIILWWEATRRSGWLGKRLTTTGSPAEGAHRVKACLTSMMAKQGAWREGKQKKATWHVGPTTTCYPTCGTQRHVMRNHPRKQPWDKKNKRFLKLRGHRYPVLHMRDETQIMTIHDTRGTSKGLFPKRIEAATQWPV